MNILRILSNPAVLKMADTAETLGRELKSITFDQDKIILTLTRAIKQEEINSIKEAVQSLKPKGG